jgi:putative RNA 2'-phosphotransferase
LHLTLEFPMDASLKSHSKFLSLVLRHQPELIGIELDPAGWTSVDGLLAAATAASQEIDYDRLLRIVYENDKQRFALSDDGLRIRANQGHSVSVELGYQPVAPPEVLYHGTVEKFLAAIMQEGLRPQSRHHVHLSADKKTAKAVGCRRGKPILLEIAAMEMHAEGVSFFRSANGVWLTDTVPPEFLAVIA